MSELQEPRGGSAGASDRPVQGALGANRVSPWKVLAWAMWDWGTQPFATVVTTFVFSVYLTSSVFGDKDELSIRLAWVTAAAGVLIALLAPVLGQGSDRTGKRMFNLRWQTLLLAAVCGAMYFVAPEPQYWILGALLLGAGNIVSEVANVNYYASIDQVSTPQNVGRVSGVGWGMGYLGGIVILLLIIVVRGSDFGPDDVRVAMLFCGAWTVLFTIPTFLAIRDVPRTGPVEKVGFFASYRELWASIKRIYATSPSTIHFLIASAIFRDGLAGVFTFGGILAEGTFGFTFFEVVVFGVVANVTAGLSTMAFGALDDKIGPKKVIVISLVSMVVLGLLVFFLHSLGSIVFWVCGLLLTVFVGPAQSASRSYLARLIPAGKSGEVFGLYATTGRAVSFLSSTAFGAAIAIAALIGGPGKWQFAGILGIVAVLLVGLLVLLPVKSDSDHRSH
ncbi:MFS transporter [Tessaracoccus caeni]|uniref:MFS transporter n=1 Tax=Tessaracoccus caeni TaxID=3031239 RepID=UPI0023D9AA84|nr:MFS transporter [Tessaracoccus caeni]MDF1488207.1 MFS transporter [Tessaracoccus caeni]